MSPRQGEEREERGEAMPGDAQSSRPPVDPEMIRGEEEGRADDEAERDFDPDPPDEDEDDPAGADGAD